MGLPTSAATVVAGPRVTRLAWLFGRASFCIFFLAAVYQYWTFVRVDPFLCTPALDDGHWVNTSAIRPFETWRANRCTLHEYSRDEFRDCLQGRRVVFVGDSTTRQLYWAAANRLDHFKEEVAMLDFHVRPNKQRPLSLEAEKVFLEFIWDPWLNSTALREELVLYRNRDQKAAGLLILGAPGLFAARHGGSEYLDIFRRSINSIRPFLAPSLPSLLSGREQPVEPTFEGLPDQILVAPVIMPRFERLSRDRRAVMTASKVDAMNGYLWNLPWTERSHILWSYRRMIEGGSEALGEDGIHVVKDVRAREITVALNVRCNSGLKITEQQTPPTCCVPQATLPKYQARYVYLGLLLAPSLLFLRLPWTPRPESRQTLFRPRSLLILTPLIVALAAAVTADRSLVFSSLDKEWNYKALKGDLILFLAIAFVSFRTKTQPPEFSGEPVFLPREQANEWKGLIQGAIALCHYFGNVEESITLYKLSRLSVAAYIFLSTYGHAAYFLATRDFSFRRFAAILLRFNTLSIFLSYAMGTSWMAYYFAPLASFWFCITYSTFAIGKDMNKTLPALLLKILFSSIFTCQIAIPYFPSLCRWAQVIFPFQWDPAELVAHITMDRFIPFVGMALAVTVHRITLLRSRQAPQNENHWSSTLASELDSTLKELLSLNPPPPSRRDDTQSLRPILILSSILILLFLSASTMPATVLPSQHHYDPLHPYTSCIAISSLIYLRNSIPALKRTYLSLPATIGNAALEMYLLHHHIFLSNNGTNRLQILFPYTPAQKFLERVILFAALAWLSVAVRKATLHFIDILTCENEAGSADSVLARWDSAGMGRDRRVGVVRQRVFMRLVQSAKAKVFVFMFVVWVFTREGSVTRTV